MAETTAHPAIAAYPADVRQAITELARHGRGKDHELLRQRVTVIERYLEARDWQHWHFEISLCDALDAADSGAWTDDPDGPGEFLAHLDWLDGWPEPSGKQLITHSSAREAQE